MIVFGRLRAGRLLDLNLIDDAADATHLLSVFRSGFLLKTGVDISVERHNSVAYLNADSLVWNIAIKLQGLSNIPRDIVVRPNAMFGFASCWH